MAESIIRKACDRCHSQKLSCKRTGDEACERCVRLRTECKSSPSLRYKKQHQKLGHPYQQQQQRQPYLSQQQHPQPPQSSAVGNNPIVGRRLPKRRRTISELSLVSRDGGLPLIPQTTEIITEEYSTKTTGTPLEPTNFDFRQFEQLGFFSSPSVTPILENSVAQAEERLRSFATFTDSWESQLHQPNCQFPPQSAGFSPGDNSRFSPAVSAPSIGGEASVQGIARKSRRSRGKSRPRQIALRQVANAPTPSEESSNVHWMAQLSEINSRLLDLASILPQQQAITCNVQPVGRQDSFTNPGFPIDEMFKLTRRVADVLDCLSSKEEAGDAGSVASHIDGSDPGNSMFVLSTYVRLLDMYQKVFGLVRAELSQAHTGTAFRFWRLPDVQVGSFAVDPSPPLQMSLTIQLAEEFLARLRTATAALDPALRNGHKLKTRPNEVTNGTSMFSDVVDVSFRAVKKKEESLGKHLAELRDEIEAVLNP